MLKYVTMIERYIYIYTVYAVNSHSKMHFCTYCKSNNLLHKEEKEEGLSDWAIRTKDFIRHWFILVNISNFFCGTFPIWGLWTAECGGVGCSKSLSWWLRTSQVRVITIPNWKLCGRFIVNFPFNLGHTSFHVFQYISYKPTWLYIYIYY